MNVTELIPIPVGLEEKVGVFVFIYLLTVIPCWIAVFKFFSSLKNGKLRLAIIWAISLFLLLVLPYAYALTQTDSLVWQLVVLVVLIPSYGLMKLLFWEQKSAPATLWDWYANHYDALMQFEPYKSLVADVAEETHRVKPAGRVIEMGVGTGNILFELQKKGKYEITGVDSSDAMLHEVKKKDPTGKLKLQKMDLNAPDLSSYREGYDLVIMNNVLYSLNSPEEVMRKIAGILRPGGSIIVCEPKEGSSTLVIILEYLKKDPLKNLLKIFRHAAPFISILVVNFLISLKASVKKYTFFSEGELNTILIKSGLVIVHERELYCHQNILVVATKHAS